MGSGTQKLVPKWPDQIFPVVNFLFSHNGYFGRVQDGRGGGGTLLQCTGLGGAAGLGSQGPQHVHLKMTPSLHWSS